MCDSVIPNYSTYTPTYEEYQPYRAMPSAEVRMHIQNTNTRCKRGGAIKQREHQTLRLIKFRSDVLDGRKKAPVLPPPTPAAPAPKPSPTPPPPTRIPTPPTVSTAAPIVSGIPTPYMARFNILKVGQADKSTRYIRSDLLTVTPNSEGRIMIDPMNLRMTRIPTGIIYKPLFTKYTTQDSIRGDPGNITLIDRLLDYESEYDAYFDQNGFARPIRFSSTSWSSEYGNNKKSFQVAMPDYKFDKNRTVRAAITGAAARIGKGM